MSDTERVNPSPGEIAETIISDFYQKWYHVSSQSRVEEMLKRIWFLLLEQKAERGGFDD